LSNAVNRHKFIFLGLREDPLLEPLPNLPVEEDTSTGPRRKRTRRGNPRQAQKQKEREDGVQHLVSHER
jgi:hypothetical protein